MGKGQRLRAARAIEKEAHRAEMEKKVKKNKILKILCSVIAIVLVLSIAGGFIYNGVYSASYKRGDIQRKTIIYRTSSQKVDAAMMSYFFYTQYNSFVNTYQSALSSFKLDTSKPLKNQDCVLSGGDSWFDYFMNQTKSQVEDLVVLADKASKEGMNLEETDTKSIDDSIKTYKDYGDENGISSDEIFSRIFGTGVKEKDVRNAMTLSMLAQKYYKKYQDSLDYSETDIEQYYKDNINNYRSVDYYTYTVSADNLEDPSTYPSAEAKATELAACQNADAFKNAVEKIVKEKKTDEEITEEDLKSEIDSAMESISVTGEKFSEESEYSEWLFNTAKAGATKIFDDEKGNYTVLLLIKEPYRDESDTKTIRNIVFLNSSYTDAAETENKATEIFGEIKEAGLTEETFKEYAGKYSNDTSTAQNGGLSENYTKDSFDSAVADWAFDPVRKEGDYEIVQTGDGVSICYYIGNGLKAWQAKCLTDMKSKDYEDSLKQWKDDSGLIIKESGLNKIPDIA